VPLGSRKRVILGLTSPLFLVAAVAVVTLVPGPHTCLSFDCGPHFDSGAIDVFGSGNLTLAQTLVLAAGIWIAAWLLIRVVLPTKPLTSTGIATMVLAVAIAWLLPSQVVGPEPSVACSSPGAGGRPIEGRCATGPPPMDDRLQIRVLVLAAGLSGLGLGAIGERARTHRKRFSPSDS
jgi:hypothetical protein